MKAKELKELGQWKIGQEVLFKGRFFQKTCVIDRITDGRGGTIYVDKDSFDDQGRIRSGDIWVTGRIEILTPEMKEEILKRICRNKLSHFDFTSLTLDQASDIFLKMKEMGIKIEEGQK